MTAWRAPKDRPGANIIWDNFWDRPWAAGNMEYFPLSFVRTTWLANGDDSYAQFRTTDLPDIPINRLRPSSIADTRIAIDHQPLRRAIPTGSTIYLGRGDFSTTPYTFGGFDIQMKTPYTVINSGPTAIVIQSTQPLVGAVTVSTSGDLRIFHSSFLYAQDTPREQHLRLGQRVDELLADGGYFYWGGPHWVVGTSQWWDAYRKFGETAVQEFREGEWDWVASQNWDPFRVLVGCENEPISWASDSINGITQRQWYRDWVIPKMREYFPDHTLALTFGGGWKAYDSFINAASSYTMPIDNNMILDIHSYPGVGTSYQWDQEADHIAAWSAVASKARDLNFGGFLLGEFGAVKTIGSPDRERRHRWAHRHAARNGGWACYWGIQAGYDWEAASVGGYGIDGTWSPSTPANMWGPREHMRPAFMPRDRVGLGIGAPPWGSI